MIEFFSFIFRNWWTFLGCIIILGMFLQFLFLIYNRTLRHANIRKHGYPPKHCDADGDLLPIFEKEEETL